MIDRDHLSAHVRGLPAYATATDAEVDETVNHIFGFMDQFGIDTNNPDIAQFCILGSLQLDELLAELRSEVAAGNVDKTVAAHLRGVIAEMQKAMGRIAVGDLGGVDTMNALASVLGLLPMEAPS